jgi:hypothetical protein
MWFENTSNRSRVAFGSVRVVASWPASDAPFGVVLADVDRDGDRDAVHHLTGGDRVVWYLSDGASPPSFSSAVTVAVRDGPNFRPVVSDVNGDGAVDVVASSSNDNVFAVHVLAGAPAVGFSTIVLDTTFAGPHDVETADVDGDGDMDVVGAAWSADAVLWFENDGMMWPSFAVHVIGVGSPFVGCRRAVPVDVDGDGDLDIVTASAWSNAVTWIENISPINRSRFRVIFPPTLNSSAVLPRRHAHPVVGDVVTARLLHVDGGYRPVATSPCTVNGVDVSPSFVEPSRGRYEVSFPVSLATDVDWPWTGLTVDCTLTDFRGNVIRVTARGVVGAALRWLGGGGGDGGVSSAAACGISGCVNGSVLRSGVSAWLDVDGDGDMDGVVASSGVGSLRLLLSVNGGAVSRSSGVGVGLVDVTGDASRGVPVMASWRLTWRATATTTCTWWRRCAATVWFS